MRVSDIMKKLSSPPSPIVWPKDNPVVAAQSALSLSSAPTEELRPGVTVRLSELEAAAELVSAAIDLQKEASVAIQDVAVPQSLEPAIDTLVSALMKKIDGRPMAPFISQAPPPRSEPAEDAERVPVVPAVLSVAEEEPAFETTPPPQESSPASPALETSRVEMVESGGEMPVSPVAAPTIAVAGTDVASGANDAQVPITIPAYVCVSEDIALTEPLPVGVTPASAVPEAESAGNGEGGLWKDGDATLCHLWQTVENFLQKVRAGQRPNPDAVIKTADILIESLKRNDDLVKVLFVKKESGDLASRLIDVAVVAAKIGFSLRYETDRLQELVLCALLHDVGMLKVPEGIVNKKEKLDDSELAEIRRHPQYGQEILRNIPGLPPVVAEAAYQEQEREDGSGYPQGLRGDSINEYAKIIGLAVLFTAMLQPRPQRARRIPFEIIKEIIDHNKAQFPLYLIRILIDELSLFPEGLYVTLNTGEIGRVLRTSRLAPMRPVIEIVRDVHGRPPRERREYDLMKEQILRIEDALFEII